MKVNKKPILLQNSEAIKLAEERAVREHRPKAQAVAVTIIEHLGPGKGEREPK